MKRFVELLMLVCTLAISFVAVSNAKEKKKEMGFPFKTTTFQNGKIADDTEWYLISIGSDFLSAGNDKQIYLKPWDGDFTSSPKLWAFVEVKGKIRIFSHYANDFVYEKMEGSNGVFLNLMPSYDLAFHCSVESGNKVYFYTKALGMATYFEPKQTGMQEYRIVSTPKFKSEIKPFSIYSYSELVRDSQAKKEEAERKAAEAERIAAEKKAKKEAAEAECNASVADKVKKSRETDFVETDAYYGAPTKFKRTYNDGTIAVYDYYVSFDKRLKITHRNGSTTTHSYSVDNTKEMNRLTEIYLCKSVENYPEIEQTSSEEELTELRSALSAAKEKANEIQRKEKQDEENRIKNEREAKEKSLIAKYGRNYVENLKQGVMSIGMPLALLQEAKDGIWIEEENRHVYVKLKMTQQTSAWTTYTYKIQKGVLYNEGAIHVNNKGKVSYIKIWENCLN